jgi:uncharacterized tellurite resistance protein B-like protein
VKELSRDERMLLLEVACSFAWADRSVHPEERRLIQHLADRLGLAPRDQLQVEAWLDEAPTGDVDAARIPREHRARFVQAAESVIAVDGEIAASEREQLLRLVRRLA